MLEGEATKTLAVPPPDAYAAVADVDAYPAWQSLVDGLEVRERDAEGRPVVVATRLDAGVKVLSLVLRYAYAPPLGVSFERVEGDLSDIRGAWQVERDGDDGARVTYRVAVDPGFALGLLMRGPAADRVRRKVVDDTLDDLGRRLGDERAGQA